jgi:ASC-1-like (ASCH) protein
MEHLAILSKKRKLLDRILSGEKNIESRWYKFKKPPFGNISIGDMIYFKESGCPVTAKAEIKNFIVYENLTMNKIVEIINDYGSQIGIDMEYADEVKDKNICILIFLKNPNRIEPFEIDKKGYGIMSAWISIDDIRKLRK